MQVNVDKKLDFKIAGQSFTIKSREDAEDIKKEFLKEYEELIKSFGSAFGLMEYNAIDQNYNYFIGFEICDPDLIENNNFIINEIPESTYLEVPVDTDGGIKEAYRYTYEDYFPNKKYFHGLGPDIEFYQYDEENNSIGNTKLFICLRENPHA